MKVTRTASAAFTAEFESDEELREEFRTNLMFGALAIPTDEVIAVDTALLVTLRGPAGDEAAGVRVAQPPDAPAGGDAGDRAGREEHGPQDRGAAAFAVAVRLGVTSGKFTSRPASDGR